MRTILLAVFLVFFLGACDGGAGDPDGSVDRDGGTGRDSGRVDIDAGVPEATCEAVPLFDVSTPTTVVGDGTAASCTETAFRDAAAIGGTITFSCGAAPITITVTSQIVFTDATVLDGGGTVTLSGGNSTRILYLDSGYDQTEPRLVVQRLAFVDGASAREDDDTASGGAAIYRDGGSLTVIDCTFTHNIAPSPDRISRAARSTRSAAATRSSAAARSPATRRATAVRSAA